MYNFGDIRLDAVLTSQVIVFRISVCLLLSTLVTGYTVNERRLYRLSKYTSF